MRCSPPSMSWRRVSASAGISSAERITEADWRLFTTLIRFDAVYFGHFKCNMRRIVDYPNLWGYLRELYQVPGVAADRALRSYQGALLRQPPDDQPNRNHSEGPGPLTC